MDYRSLIANLETEQTLQTTLLEAVREEQVALATMNVEQINSLVTRKASILEKIQDNHEKRNKIFVKDNLLPLELLKLEDIIANCSSVIYSQQLNKLQDDLREIVTELTTLNKHNAGLAKQGLDMATTTLAIFKSAANNEPEIPAYTAKATFKNKELDPVFSIRNMAVARSV